jgi:anti-anti-sigma regulatory factor
MTVLPEELVIAQIGEASRDVSDAIAWETGEDGRVLAFDGSRVRRIDGVGLQLLIACHKAAEAKGMTLRIENCSEALRDALGFTGVAEQYGIGVR